MVLARIVVFEETGEERAITGGCLRCGVTPSDVAERSVIVSPAGKAHHGADYGMTACGMTACGIDATGDGWWWPL